MKVLLYTLFLIGLVYLVLPGPGSINNIPQIPNSLKSDEPGDTSQVPNIAAYFSLEKRDSVTKFYYESFSYLNIFGFKIPPIKFNHPVENAKVSVRDQIKSTYLEEYLYPFRDSLFVNGFDQDVWNKLNHIQSDGNNETIIIGDGVYNSKTTLRYHPSSAVSRVIVYAGSWVLGFALLKVFLKAWKKY